MNRYKQHRTPRTTLDLKGTYKATEAHLDFRSWLALMYSRIWVVAAGSPKPPNAGIIRRALQVYVEHLGSADPNEEARAVRNACSVSPTDEDEQQKAEMRMYANPLPLFSDVITGPVRARELLAMVENADALADSIIAGRHAVRVRGRKASTAKRAAAQGAST